MKSNASEAEAMGREVGRLVEVFRRIASAAGQDAAGVEEFRERYGKLPQGGRTEFFLEILRGMEVRKKDVEGALKALLEGREEDVPEWGGGLAELRRAVESPRTKAFQRFANARGGLKFLLDFRADLLAAQRNGPEELKLLDQEVAHLFNIWFQQGFLFLRQITQDSPYRQIRFLKEHDLVHPMSSIEEMGDRLGEDRLCFALFHQAMPDEMVIFIEVALTKGVAKSVQDVIGGERPRAAGDVLPDAAVFYSINNAQNGLGGLGFGKLLIFQVVDLIRKTHPHVETFATLSPIPGFWERYAKRILQGDDGAFAMKKADVEGLFSEKARAALAKRHEERTGTAAGSFAEALLGILGDPSWIEDAECAKWLEKPLVELAYWHVAKEKGRQGAPLNPVASFHLGNGAEVSRSCVRFGGNPTARGLAESCGVMVNYVYSAPWRHQVRKTVKSLLPWKNG